MSQQPTSQVLLLIRTRELGALRGLLLHLHRLPPKERTFWLEENADTLTRAFSLFVEASNRTLDQIGIDDESLELSYELVSGLKETEHMVEEILGDEHQLRS